MTHMLQQENVVGILEIYNGPDFKFDQDEIRTLSIFFAQATTAVINHMKMLVTRL